MPNYLFDLPTDLQDKIFTIANKDKFNKVLTDINNEKIRKFYRLYDMINDDWFGITFDLYGDIINKGLGWFGNTYADDEIDDDRQIAYDAYERDKRLSYKEYTLTKPEYKRIKYYRFIYYNYEGRFNKVDLLFINRMITEYLKKFYEDEIFKKVIFKNNKIDIYFDKSRKYDETAVDIIQNIFWAYKLIMDSLEYTTISGLDVGYIIDWFENHNFLECFEIKKQIVMPYFGS